MYDDTITFDRLEPNEQAVITEFAAGAIFQNAPENPNTRGREQIAHLLPVAFRPVCRQHRQELRLFEVQALRDIRTACREIDNGRGDRGGGFRLPGTSARKFANDRRCNAGRWRLGRICRLGP